jgi:D-alanyl-D-alanine dipeptidase
MFPLDTAFGFAPRDSMQNVRLPYVQLLPTTDCVDDTASTHYNTVVDRAAVSRVDWNSAEHMRQVAQYKTGVIVGYNASLPVKGRGSCIFLHIWAGPVSHTAGCTAFDEAKLREVMLWLDPDKRPVLVQLTADEYNNLQARWRLPALD